MFTKKFVNNFIFKKTGFVHLKSFVNNLISMKTGFHSLKKERDKRTDGNKTPLVSCLDGQHELFVRFLFFFRDVKGKRGKNYIRAKNLQISARPEFSRN